MKINSDCLAQSTFSENDEDAAAADDQHLLYIIQVILVSIIQCFPHRVLGGKLVCFPQWRSS